MGENKIDKFETALDSVPGVIKNDDEISMNNIFNITFVMTFIARSPPPPRGGGYIPGACSARVFA